MDAALREVLEETGLSLRPESLSGPATFAFRHEHRPIISTIYTAQIEQQPTIQIDGAEIVWAAFLSKTELGAQQILAPGLLAYLHSDLRP